MMYFFVCLLRFSSLKKMSETKYFDYGPLCPFTAISHLLRGTTFGRATITARGYADLWCEQALARALGIFNNLQKLTYGNHLKRWHTDEAHRWGAAKRPSGAQFFVNFMIGFFQNLINQFSIYFQFKVKPSCSHDIPLFLQNVFRTFDENSSILWSLGSWQRKFYK